MSVPVEATANPLLSEWTTQFGVPPFPDIAEHHYEPAFDQAVARHREEIAAIVAAPEPPTFANTIEALERSGRLLQQVIAVFSNLNASHTNDEVQAIARRIYPRLTSHRDDILLDARLFGRIAAVHECRDELQLGTEQRMLLDETYRDFVRGGANLGREKQARLRAINEELSRLTTDFGENLLKETNAIALLVEDEAALDGLPESARAAAAETAASQGHPGRWAFTLQRTSWTPLLQLARHRDLRQRIFQAYANLGSNGNELDNRDAVSRIALLRAERARLLGYATHADYVLERTMAREPSRVRALLEQLWTAALDRARAERAELQAMIRQEGADFPLAAWDWWYYAEKLRQAKFEFDEEDVKPYLRLDRVRQAAFDVASHLFGLQFELREDVPVYHPDVRAYEVRDADGAHLGLFLVDDFTRPSKRGGAWMSNFREQYRDAAGEVRPIIVNVCNFSKPAAGAAALLSLDEARTLFHEFGHALHGLLARGMYASLTGTNVPRDFVELPSQMMENWAFAPEVLRGYARHHASDEPIPQGLVQKLARAEQFNQGFATTEYLAASLLDLGWHTLAEGEPRDAQAFERELLQGLGLIPEILPRYRSPYFAHIFAGGYSAGYYSYIWAEVLDADGFALFQERGLFDPETARSYRRNILEPGGGEPPLELYRRFRGAEPTIDALLERRGLR